MREAPPLVGLVLAGGHSRRMGRDKGSLTIDGVTQAERAVTALTTYCESVYVSVRPAQAASEPYCRLPLVEDREQSAGPVAGLLAAWAKVPDAALFVLAADMPFVDIDLLGKLVAERDPRCSATAYRHGEGLFEPLCAIWEPAAAAVLADAVQGEGSVSLNRMLEQLPTHAIRPADPAHLRSVNEPDDLLT